MPRQERRKACNWHKCLNPQAPFFVRGISEFVAHELKRGGPCDWRQSKWRAYGARVVLAKGPGGKAVANYTEEIASPPSGISSMFALSTRVPRAVRASAACCSRSFIHSLAFEAAASGRFFSRSASSRHRNKTTSTAISPTRYSGHGASSAFILVMRGNANALAVARKGTGPGCSSTADMHCARFSLSGRPGPQCSHHLRNSGPSRLHLAAARRARVSGRRPDPEQEST